MEAGELAALALEAARYSYSPYSNYRVGAALLCGSGKVYTGCNVENASYCGTICAERTAAVKAVSAGERVFVAIAVTGSPAEGTPQDYAWPCGLCRQVLNEFAAPGMQVYVVRTPDDIRAVGLDELLPHAFGSAQLGDVQPGGIG